MQCENWTLAKIGGRKNGKTWTEKLFLQKKTHTHKSVTSRMLSQWKNKRKMREQKKRGKKWCEPMFNLFTFVLFSSTSPSPQPHRQIWGVFRYSRRYNRYFAIKTSHKFNSLSILPAYCRGWNHTAFLRKTDFWNKSYFSSCFSPHNPHFLVRPPSG